MACSSGKVILLGEHAVVYGVPALAVGIPRGATATAASAARTSLVVEVPGAEPLPAETREEPLRAFEALLSALGAGPQAACARLDLPPGAGLGGSAALGVALARAALEAEGRAQEVDRVLAGAEAWERVFHGNPSGVDAAASALGGCLRFVRGEPPARVRLRAPLRLGVAVAGPPASTRAMVEGLAARFERDPGFAKRSLEAIGALVGNGILALEQGDHRALGRLLDMNQMVLAGMMLSTEELERACRLAREAGALGAKLTGAGGGGSVVAVLEGDGAAVLTAWEKAGLRCFSVTVEPP